MTHITISQQFFLSNPIQSQTLNIQPEKTIAQFSPKELLVLNLILKLANKYRYLYPSHKRIASMANVSERTAYRAIAKLESLGLISHYRRLKYMTNLYRIADIFWDPLIRARLSSWLPALKWIPIIVLAGINMTLFSRYGNGYKIGKNIPLKNSVQSENGSLSFVLREFSYLGDSLFINRPALRSKGQAGRCITDDKKGVGVEQFVQKRHGISLICPELREIPWLTDYGKAKLACFPQEAIKQALSRLSSNNPGNIKDPYRLFFYFAMEYCNQKNIRADYAYSSSLEKDFDKTCPLTIMDLFLSPGKSAKEKTATKGVFRGISGHDNNPGVRKQEKIAELKRDIIAFTEHLANPPAHLSGNPYGEYFIGIAKRALSVKMDELKELEQNGCTEI